MMLAIRHRRAAHLHAAVPGAVLTERARTGRPRNGELQEKQVHDDRREAAEVPEAAHELEYREWTGHPVSTPYVSSPE
jgi:hypothetical protein